MIYLIKNENGIIHLQKPTSEKQINQLMEIFNFNIIEISYDDVISGDFNADLTFNADKYTARKNKEKAQNELNELKNWFDIEYMRLEQKFRRLHTLGKEYKGISAYDALIQLYNQAESVRARINELEALIGN